jgi:hypothetical protein
MNATLIASFKTESDAEIALNDLNCPATRVSGLICRYAIEVSENVQTIANILREKYQARVNDNFLNTEKPRKKFSKNKK